MEARDSEIPNYNCILVKRKNIPSLVETGPSYVIWRN